MRLNSLTLGARIAITTSLLVSALVLLASYGLHALATINSSFEFTANHTAPKAVLFGHLSQAISDMAAGQRGVLAFTYAKDPARRASARELFQGASARAQSSLASLQQLNTTGQEKTALRDVGIELNQWIAAYAEVDQLAGAGDADQAVNVLSQKIAPLYQSSSEKCRTLMTLIDQALQTDRQTVSDQHASSQWIMIFLALMGGAAAVGALWVGRSVTAQLRRFATEMLEGSRQVSSASGQVAATSQSLAQGTSEQAATLEETSSSTAEITSITKKNSQNTRAVAGLMDQTARLVQGANHNLEEMVQSMKEINGSSEKISKIIKVIDEIAFQTNILALNAAVEAARAGEAGMGFAVVADEVRNLAHRSAQAAKDTAALIEESILKSSLGSKKLDQVAKSIREITSSSAQVKTLVDEVDTGSQEQARGIEQIAMAVGQMEQVTQRSAAGAEQSAAASEQLAAQAQALQAIVERVRVLVGTDSASALGTQSHLMSSPPPSISSSRDLAALGSALRDGDANSAAASLVRNRTSFPLDEQESGF